MIKLSLFILTLNDFGEILEINKNMHLIKAIYCTYGDYLYILFLF